jgi:L-asparaginase
MNKKRIIVLTTGGTIEKSYDEQEGDLQNRESLLERKLLSRLRLPHTEVRFRVLMAKDSLHMTASDREFIWQAISESFQHRIPIVVLHGTDTMALTLKYCFSKEPSPPVPVLFTGAMKPVGFDDSDATQNFAEAMVLAHYVEPGFYISFHNHLFAAPNVDKNKSTGTFESY